MGRGGCLDKFGGVGRDGDGKVFVGDGVDYPHRYPELRKRPSNRLRPKEIILHSFPGTVSSDASTRSLTRTTTEGERGGYRTAGSPSGVNTTVPHPVAAVVHISGILIVDLCFPATISEHI